MLKLGINLLIVIFMISCNGLNQNLGLYNLKINESKIVNDSDNQVMIIDIQDSRCPKGAKCITEGYAQLTIKIIENKVEKIIKLKTDDKKHLITDKFRYKIIDLVPYPELNKELKLSDYVAVISVQQR